MSPPSPLVDKNDRIDLVSNFDLIFTQIPCSIPNLPNLISFPSPIMLALHILDCKKCLDPSESKCQMRLGGKDTWWYLHNFKFRVAQPLFLDTQKDGRLYRLLGDNEGMLG